MSAEIQSAAMKDCDDLLKALEKTSYLDTDWWIKRDRRDGLSEAERLAQKAFRMARVDEHDAIRRCLIMAIEKAGCDSISLDLLRVMDLGLLIDSGGDPVVAERLRREPL